MKRDFTKSDMPVDLDLPKEYLINGYFNSKGNLLDNYVWLWAEEIAKKLGQARPDMKKHQLRRFYNHVKSLERKLTLTDYDSINADLKMLISHAVNAAHASPPKIPKLFEEFIRKNLAMTKDSKTFRGFLEHFQAIVGFSEAYLRKN